MGIKILSINLLSKCVDCGKDTMNTVDQENIYTIDNTVYVDTVCAYCECSARRKLGE